MSIIISTVFATCMALGVIFIRLKAAKKPTNLKKIILPPFFMSTGALMYVVPQFRLTSTEILEAIFVGLFFSLFLIKTSKFEIIDNEIYLKRSKSFVFILLGLLVVRIVMKLYLSSSIDVEQLSGMFFLLAFSMILPWRLAMYKSYTKMRRQLPSNTIIT
ncbi:CcdC family protein [Bacillus sp. EAC]|uniref:CcdC family protein n=1 Tax=Bacillus sp. EAC TaxID=1978338 RepID=UPI000B4416F1|nr:cytochrome c biogenesis protein CcdC [Bacillus sp. EAC]